MGDVASGAEIMGAFAVQIEDVELGVILEFTTSSRFSVVPPKTYSELRKLWCAVLGVNQRHLR